MLNIFKNIKLSFKLFQLFIVYLIIYLLGFIINSFNIITTNKYIIAIYKIV